MKNSVFKHEEIMQRAISLSHRGRFTAPPNPWVGCVIVKNGVVIGEGWHERPGEAHAEVIALQQAGDAAKGADLYCTLEPCSHTGKTKPCAEALIVAGVARVFVGTLDPDPLVSGKGIQKLREAGIATEIGLLEKEVKHSLRSYLFQRAEKRPYCVLKLATSVDGRIAAEDGSSQWITPIEARTDAHRLRAESQAILIGSGTAVQDRPSLTVREYTCELDHQPLRVILDTRGRCECVGPLFNTNVAATLFITTESCDGSVIKKWKDSGCEVEIVSTVNGRVSLAEAMQCLQKRAIIQVMIEGGAQVAAECLAQAYVNELHQYIGPKLIGDKGLPCTQGLPFTSLSEALDLKFETVQELGSSVKLHWTLAR
jgi:diaminohydroxyphosphoribosylaminopyrimidine deaminase/5-amino-6-(5-phosphoribosylamino)uracil reductase